MVIKMTRLLGSSLQIQSVFLDFLKQKYDKHIVFLFICGYLLLLHFVLTIIIYFLYYSKLYLVIFCVCTYLVQAIQI